jgi:hypothetical protein
MMAPALGLCQLTATANDIEPTKEFYNATRINKSVAIDGALPEWAGVPVLADPKFAVPKYSGTNAQPNYVLFEVYSGGTWTGPDDQTSAVQVIWDADNVYFGFVVTDDYHENAANSAWNGDSVQLMIADATRTQQIALYNYALGGVEDALGDVIINHEAGPGGDATCNCPTEAVVKRDLATKRTIYEIKLPAASLGLTAPLQAGTKFGLGMAINDGDKATDANGNPTGQQGQKGWGGLGAHSIVFGKTPSQTALVTLVTNLPSVDRIFLSAINPGILAFSFRANDKGASIVAPASAKLVINGQTVTLTVSPKVGDATDFTYKPPTPFPSGSSNSYSIEVKDTQGNAVTDAGTFITPAYVLLPPANKVTPDTTKPGFIWNIFANSANQVNSNQRTEDALAGRLKDASGAPLPNLADPAAQGVAIAASTAPSPANAPIKFEIDSVINVSQNAGEAHGTFPDEGQMPGVPPSNGVSDGLAVEILTFLELPAGITTMGVNSDDGFRTTAGNPSDAFGAVTLGEFNGGRGAGDTLFNFVVQEAGVYAFRTAYEEGGGDANIEWFTVKSDGSKVLVNDTANGGVKAYRARTGTIDPYIKSVSPAPVPRQLEGVSSSISIVLSDGTPNTVNDSSIVLQVDGQTVTPTKARSGATVTLTFTPAGLLVPGDQHTANLTFKDSSGALTRNQQWTFYNLQNLILPASPVTGENFDSFPEATSPATTVPPGWSVTNYTWLEVSPPAGPGVWDLTDNANDPFVNWVMIKTETVLPLEDEVLDNDKTQLINGQPVASWMSGNLLYAASDGRARRVSIGGANQPNDYAPQIQIVVSKAFNLSTVTNPVLTFSSGVRISGNHEQDSLEYSVDDGATWLPAIIMQNLATVFLNADGSYDAVKMLNNVWADVAKFPVVQDPSTRDFISAGPKGQKFGDVLLTPISAALAPYIVNRNDTVAARRVEAIRLPAASKKSQVRLRFNHYGSCGWEWGIDNIAFYDIAPPGGSGGAPPTLSITKGAGAVVITFEGTLQQTDTLNGTWSNVSGGSPITVSSATGTKFYRASR